MDRDEHQDRRGLNTLEPQNPDDRLTRLVPARVRPAAKPLAETRVLDLACLEGHYAIEFGLSASRVVGIEVREANIAKARFAKEALGLDRVELRPGRRPQPRARRNTADVRYRRSARESSITWTIPTSSQFVEHIARRDDRRWP